MNIPVIILAAGQGKRFQSKEQIRHKSLIEINGRALIIVSIEKLLLSGFKEIIVVLGYEAEAVAEVVTKKFGNRIKFILNNEYASCGSLVSVIKGIENIETNCLVLDADIIYEGRALTTIEKHIGENGFITTYPSGNGDEVFVESTDTIVSLMAKKTTGRHLKNSSEYIGIMLLSNKLVNFLRTAVSKDHHALDYEAYINYELISKFHFREYYIEDLIWTEVDTISDLNRLRKWPIEVIDKLISK